MFPIFPLPTHSQAIKYHRGGYLMSVVPVAPLTAPCHKPKDWTALHVAGTFKLRNLCVVAGRTADSTEILSSSPCSVTKQPWDLGRARPSLTSQFPHLLKNKHKQTKNVEDSVVSKLPALEWAKALADRTRSRPLSVRASSLQETEPNSSKVKHKGLGGSYRIEESLKRWIWEWQKPKPIQQQVPRHHICPSTGASGQVPADIRFRLDLTRKGQCLKGNQRNLPNRSRCHASRKQWEKMDKCCHDNEESFLPETKGLDHVCTRRACPRSQHASSAPKQ